MAKRAKTTEPTVDSLLARLDEMVAQKPDLSWDSFMENADDLYTVYSIEWYQEVIGEALDATEWAANDPRKSTTGFTLSGIEPF